MKLLNVIRSSGIWIMLLLVGPAFTAPATKAVGYSTSPHGGPCNHGHMSLFMAVARLSTPIKDIWMDCEVGVCGANGSVARKILLQDTFVPFKEDAQDQGICVCKSPEKFYNSKEKKCQAKPSWNIDLENVTKDAIQTVPVTGMDSGNGIQSKNALESGAGSGLEIASGSGARTGHGIGTSSGANDRGNGISSSDLIGTVTGAETTRTHRTKIVAEPETRGKPIGLSSGTRGHGIAISSGANGHGPGTGINAESTGHGTAIAAGIGPITRSAHPGNRLGVLGHGIGIDSGAGDHGYGSQNGPNIRIHRGAGNGFRKVATMHPLLRRLMRPKSRNGFQTVTGSGTDSGKEASTLGARTKTRTKTDTWTEVGLPDKPNEIIYKHKRQMVEEWNYHSDHVLDSGEVERILNF